MLGKKGMLEKTSSYFGDGDGGDSEFQYALGDSGKGQEFEGISEDPAEIKTAKTKFYNDPRTHYLFFKKATELAAERWYEKFMSDKTFSWTLKFSDIKKNESTKYGDYKYIVTARYYSGSSLIGLGGLYIKLYTNDDSNAMTEIDTKVKIKGKCVGFNESMGYYYIDFVE